MDLIVEKQRIKQELDLITDESIILTIKRVLGLIKDQKPQPLTKEDIIARAMESEKAINKNQFITLEELEREMKNW